MLWASQVAPGCENDLNLRVYGELGGLEWSQEDPNRLWVTRHGEAKRLLTRGGPWTGASALAASRVPAGHPEGYLEGFANIYGDAARAIRARAAGGGSAGGGSAESAAVEALLPGVRDGVLGLRFIDACVRSSTADGRFVALEPESDA